MIRKSGVTDSTNYRLRITTFIINESSSVFMLGWSNIGTKQGWLKEDRHRKLGTPEGKSEQETKQEGQAQIPLLIREVQRGDELKRIRPAC